MHYRYYRSFCALSHAECQERANHALPDSDAWVYEDSAGLRYTVVCESYSDAVVFGNWAFGAGMHGVETCGAKANANDRWAK